MDFTGQSTKVVEIEKSQSLEQRLAACRDALEKFEGCLDCYECSGTAEAALTLTAPKQ